MMHGVSCARSTAKAAPRKPHFQTTMNTQLYKNVIAVPASAATVGATTSD